MKSVAVVIIGREILTGKFADQNGPFLIQRLRSLGSSLVRLATIDDELDDIATEVRTAAERADFVITTGGVGPTHDDVTFEGVAQAFGVPLLLNDHLVALLDRFGLPKTPATLRMARVPEGTELLDSAGSSYPVIKVRNVFVLPGVPTLMKTKFESIAATFAGPELHTRRLLLSVRETSIADRLTAVVADHPRVDIGSYPRFGEGEVKVILTLESHDAAALDRADAALSDLLPVISRID